MYSKYTKTVFKAVVIVMNESIKPGDLVMSSGSETRVVKIKNFFLKHFFQGLIIIIRKYKYKIYMNDTK